MVAGELTAVSPIVQARLQQLFVHCLDRVTRGQRLAEFRNEVTVDTAAQQLLQLELELTQAQAAIQIAGHQMQVAQKLIDSQAAVLRQQTSILKAQDELMKQHYVATLVWEQAKAAVDRADADTNAAQFVFETKRADQRKAEVDAEVLQKRIAGFRNSPELTGHFFLTAPKDGIVTQCSARVGEVIAARTPIFSVFNPGDAYAVAFLNASDVATLNPGETFELDIDGIQQSVTGKLTAFYPELSALPSALTRYFWQQEKWSQYVPVRIDFVDMNAEQSGKLFASAQLSASRWRGLNVGLTELGIGLWVRQQMSGLWKIVNKTPPQLSDVQ